jgi:hypothetical protein
MIFFSCSPIKYYTYYEGGFDPTYEFKTVKTIGFTSFFWTINAKKYGIDELFEKQLFVYAKNELEKRGYKVFYISPEFLQEDSTAVDSIAVYVKPDFNNMPDLTLTVSYFQGLGNVVKIPGQTYGIINWGKAIGGGSYGKTESQEVQTCFLSICYTLWSGSPKYTNKVWQGIIKKGSPILNIQDEAQNMTNDVFLKKFDKQQFNSSVGHYTKLRSKR